MRRRVVLLFSVFSVFSVVFSQESDPKLARFNDLSNTLVCQCGCTMVLAQCGMLNCGSATPMRGIIKEEIAKDVADTEIIGKFVRQYGQVVLSAPPATGFNLTAWVMPFVVLGGGALATYFIAQRMKRARVAMPRPAGVSSGLDPRADAAIERELRNFEERE